MAYCQAALMSERSSSIPQDQYTYKGSSAVVINHDTFTLSYSDIVDAGVLFTGAHLFIAQIPKVLKYCIIP